MRRVRGVVFFVWACASFKTRYIYLEKRLIFDAMSANYNSIPISIPNFSRPKRQLTLIGYQWNSVLGKADLLASVFKYNVII